MQHSIEFLRLYWTDNQSIIKSKFFRLKGDPNPNFHPSTIFSPFQWHRILSQLDFGYDVVYNELLHYEFPDRGYYGSVHGHVFVISVRYVQCSVIHMGTLVNKLYLWNHKCILWCYFQIPPLLSYDLWLLQLYMPNNWNNWRNPEGVGKEINFLLCNC